MIRNIISFSKLYKYELILTVCLFSNLYPALPDYLYYVFLVLMALAMRMFRAGSVPRTGLAWGLIVVILLSSFISGEFDNRAIVMPGILLITLGYSSEEFYRFKIRFMYVSLMAYAFTSIINFYAKRVGANFYEGVQLGTWGASSGEFSGYTCHPMWLSAACGIGTIFFVYGSCSLRSGIVGINMDCYAGGITFCKWYCSALLPVPHIKCF